MLNYQDNLYLLEIVTSDNTDDLKKLKKILEECSIKHQALMSAVTAGDKKSRQVQLANCLFKKPSRFFKSDDEKLNKIFAFIKTKSPPVSDLSLEIYGELCLLDGLTSDAKSIMQTLSELSKIFDKQDTIIPLLQVVSGNDFFSRIEKTDRNLLVVIGRFFDSTFNAHRALTSPEDIAKKRDQGSLDIPRERFSLKTSDPRKTIVATNGLSYTLSLETTSEMPQDGAVAVKITEELGTWKTEDRKAFVDKMFVTLNEYVKMDPAMLDFWKSCLFNQEGIHCFPLIFFYCLQQVMDPLDFQVDGYNLPICLNVIQNALRGKKMLFTPGDNPHEFKLSWLGEEENFMFAIKNKYLIPSAMVDDSLDQFEQKKDFRDIEVVLEKFSILLNEAAFLDSGPIENTPAYKDCPTVTYQKCCDLFWASYANYVVKEKCKPGYLIEKENDLPALLMRCAADPELQSQSEVERKKIIKAIAFHWLQLLNCQKQSDVKEQMRLSTRDIVARLPDEVKILFAIPPMESFLSRFWSSSTAVPAPAESPMIAFGGSGSVSLASMDSGESGVVSSGSGHASAPGTPQEGGEEDLFVLSPPL